LACPTHNGTGSQVMLIGSPVLCCNWPCVKHQRRCHFAPGLGSGEDGGASGTMGSV
jgi:hypothetical protein